MARIRHLKPEFFTDRKLATLSFETRLLFAGLWCLADREGRLIDSPNFIIGQIFPHDSGITGESLLTHLASTGFIERYQVGDERYIQIINFLKHQRPHIKESQSVIPTRPARAKKHLGECLGPPKVVLNTTSKLNSNSNRELELNSNSVRGFSPVGEHQVLIAFWMEQYQHRTGVKYLFDGGKDGKAIKEVLKKLQSLDVAKMFIQEFFQTTDEFVVDRAGFTIGVFLTQLNKIAQKLSTTRVEGETELDRQNRRACEEYMRKFDKEGNRVESK